MRKSPETLEDLRRERVFPDPLSTDVPGTLTARGRLGSDGLVMIREGVYDVVVGLVFAVVVMVAVVYLVVIGVAWIGMVIGDLVVG